MAKTEHEIHTAKMVKLAASIERKAQKAFTKFPFNENLKLTASFSAGWLNGETQEEDKISMSLYSSEASVRTSLRISTSHHTYGSLRIPSDFIDNYNKIKNIRIDLARLVSNFQHDLKEKVELEARRARVPLSKGTFRNPLLQW